jgi:YVTN family beta-propeller protein
VASNTVTAINTATDTAVKSIPAGKTPAALAVTPNGKTVYVADFGAKTVTPISTATNTPGKSIEVSPVKNYNNTAIALSPDGKTLYTSGYTGGGSLNSPGYVIPIATGTGTVGQPIKVAQSPTALGITPNGAVAYVLCSGPVEKSAAEVIPIDTATGKAGPPVSRGGYPTSIVFVP